MRARACTREHAYVWARAGMRAYACTRVHACACTRVGVGGRACTHVHTRAHLFAGPYGRAHVGIQMWGGLFWIWVRVWCAGRWVCFARRSRVRGQICVGGEWVWVGVGECGRVWVRVRVGGHGCGSLWVSVPLLVGGGWVRVGASECKSQAYLTPTRKVARSMTGRRVVSHITTATPLARTTRASTTKGSRKAIRRYKSWTEWMLEGYEPQRGTDRFVGT